jgi:hypothetical protein
MGLSPTAAHIRQCEMKIAGAISLYAKDIQKVLF